MKHPSLGDEFQPLYEAGEVLGQQINDHLLGWPVSGYKPVRGSDLPPEVGSRIEELQDKAHRWFNELTILVLPRTTFDRDHTNLLLRRISSAIKVQKFYEEYLDPYYLVQGQGTPEHNIEVECSLDVAKGEVQDVIRQGLRLIRTATASVFSSDSPTASAHVPNTAFILMWMDKNHPELVDVHQGVKEVFADFGINAVRADEIQHQDRITDLILKKIAQSEFLFADLTGERPNVYYEVGFAHALRKRPILYRRKGTPLHFDLSVHNVPEYENVTQLRNLLKERLKAIIGRVPPDTR